MGRKKSELEQELQDQGFKKKERKGRKRQTTTTNEGPEEGQEEGQEGGYSYLLGMSLGELTEEKVEGLREVAEKTGEKLKILEGKGGGELWEEDLEALEGVLKKERKMFI